MGFTECNWVIAFLTPLLAWCVLLPDVSHFDVQYLTLVRG